MAVYSGSVLKVLCAVFFTEIAAAVREDGGFDDVEVFEGCWFYFHIMFRFDSLKLIFRFRYAFLQGYAAPRFLPEI